MTIRNHTKATDYNTRKDSASARAETLHRKAVRATKRADFTGVESW